MHSQPKVSVVILNWNGKHYLEKFLPSVLRSGYQNLEIIVGDNASTDNSVKFLNDNYSSVRIIANKENLGFAGGYNAILSQVESDYFVLLNSDVEVTSGWIEPIIQLMEQDQSIAVTQPKLKDFNNKNCFEYAGAAGGYIDKFGYPFCRGRIFDTLEDDTGQYETSSEIFWASGAALFIRKKCWDETSGFDADFFAHMEEIDLCWRLKNRGYKIMYCPQSVVYHVGGGTLNAESPYKTYLNFRNNLAMLLKNLPSGKVFGVIFIRFWLDFIALLKFMLNGKLKHALAISKAHTAFFKDFSENRKKRQATLLKSNKAGYYNGSIVWAYFVNKKKYFKELDV
ncbi:glycosyltransferase family 2 protein [Paradesertivirga mongoliensis]|uniref:Glycosyltransferase family 2 protein n=1 Tax=Paradesertivirga mongoliensis TaxID=2100740 RepID=A0ABW4ZQ89_9SPHI|nr:glycosyltransferase family 2 protein [Pedobacter mongoliensis]